jgi:hypothetical protein
MSIEVEEAASLFAEGIIAAWYLRPSQLEVYEHILTKRDPFIEASRRFGKTTTLLVTKLEELIQNPGMHVLWCLPDKAQARLIVLPEMQKLQSIVSDEHRFKWNTVDSYFSHPNGSKLFLRGTNHDRGDSARGLFSHSTIVDELGFINHAEYVINDILRPPLLTNNGNLITSSTPSDDLSHYYYKMRELAIRDNRFIQKTIHDNESLTPEQVHKACADVGGVESPTWKREYLCEAIANPERLVVPEFKDIHVSSEYQYLPWLDYYVGIDLGFNDYTFAVFAFYDHYTNTLVVTHEVALRGKNSKEVIDSFKEVEETNEIKPYRRVADNDLQLFHDMRTLYNYNVLPAHKPDKVASVNLLRTRFEADRIIIDPRCENLIYQLKVGMWQNDRNFMRGDRTGHLDGIDALIYLNRSLDLNRKPEKPETYTQDRIKLPFADYEKQNNLRKAFGGLRGK